MFTKSSSSRHHRRVIHEDGSPAETTARLPRVRLALLGPGARSESSVGSWLAQAGPTALTAPTRTLPVLGHGVVALRVPSAPDAPTQEIPAVTASSWVRFGFARAARELNEFVRVVSSGWRKAASENDARFRSLDERLERLAGRVRVWTIESCDADLQAAYAEGGTELVLKLTPEVLARLYAAKAGTEVSA